MRAFLGCVALCAWAELILAVPTSSEPRTPLVTSGDLRSLIQTSDLLAKSQILEDFAYTTPQRNRVFGGPGHNATVNYLYDTVAALSDFYAVELQPFVQLYTGGNASLKVNDVDQGAALFTHSTSGTFFEALVPVLSFGCNASDYPAEVMGKIALVSRGSCPFGLKSALAGVAGADAAVIYDNVNETSFAGTLGALPRPEGPCIPTAGISLANGAALLAAINTGELVIADLIMNSFAENRTTYNVVAQTKDGDPNNVLVLTAHTDSVDAGPGINDNGSGSIGLLQIALELAKFRVNNAIRFVWVAAEEFGLLGSTFYVTSLAAAELNKIRLNLNFDMIASPNYVYSVYDGDGSAFNVTGPAGSAEAEHLFEDYFRDEAKLPLVPTQFDGRSDYGPFLDAGIPTGGLFTGAEQIKTPEEQKLFGGEASTAYDMNYHAKGDNVSNLNLVAFQACTEAIAHAVATYGISFESLPPKNFTTAAPAKPPRMVKSVGMDGRVVQKSSDRFFVGM